MAIDWSNEPAVSGTYVDILEQLRERDDACATMDFTDDTNVPTGAIRWSSTNSQFEQYNGSTWANLSTALTAVCKTANNLSDLASASTARTNLGLGSLAVLSSVNNANWSGTDLIVENGGTGASTPEAARSNLGCGTISVENTPLSVAKGGTGSITAANARTQLGAAARGANADITSLTAITHVTRAGEVIIGSTNASPLQLRTNGADRFTVTSTGHLEPTTDNVSTVGTSSKCLSSVYSVGIQGISSADFVIKGQAGRGIQFMVDEDYVAMKIIGTAGANYLQVYNLGTSSSKNPASDAAVEWWEIRNASGTARFIPLYAA